MDAQSLRSVILLGLLWTGFVLAWAVGSSRPVRFEGWTANSSESVADGVPGIDPNTAPWWEFAALPRIGETIARRIVEYREDRADSGLDEGTLVFARPEHLLAVRGIGPVTLRRIRPFLEFGAALSN